MRFDSAKQAGAPARKPYSGTMPLRWRLLLWAYTAVTYLIPPPLITAIVKRLADRGYEESRTRAAERVGMDQPQRPKGRVFWILSIGPGDTRASLGLARRILAQDDDSICVLTTRTVSAQEVIAPYTNDRLHAVLSPHDTPYGILRFLRHWQPETIIFNERDVWPNMLRLLTKRGCGIALINGMIKGRLGQEIASTPHLARWMLRHLHLIHYTEESDLPEWQTLAAPDTALLYAPDFKAVAPMPAPDPALVASVRGAWKNHPVLLAQLVNATEISPLMQAFAETRQQLSDLRLILVPRWENDFDAFSATLEDHKIHHARRSAGQNPAEGDICYLADSFGEMASWAAVADIAFLGRSLAPGQTGFSPFEVAHQGCRVVTGPHISQQLGAYQALQGGGRARIIPDLTALPDVIADFLKTPRPTPGWEMRHEQNDKVVAHILALNRPQTSEFTA